MPDELIDPSAPADAEPAEAEETDEVGELTAMIEQPAKVMRIGTMVKQLLEEVRAAPLDEAGRSRLREIHEASIRELEAGLSPELQQELERLTLPFNDDVPTEAELRIAQAQLVGWLEGLFHGIQTMILAQQAAAHAQLEQLRRRSLPSGRGGGPGPVVIGPGGQVLNPAGGRLPTPPTQDDPGGTGQYL